MMETIPIASPAISDTTCEKVTEVLKSGLLASGEEVSDFEDAFAETVGSEHAIATTNGTTALHAALIASGVSEGDTVITTPLSFVATANVIRLVGATPIFADVDPETYNLDPASVERTIEAMDTGVDAILPVHLYALSADMHRFKEIADRHDATLIEDAAQALGAKFEGEMVGSFGDVACFSFYPTKNITSIEGGMITTDSEEIAELSRQYVNHGRYSGGGNYDHRSVGQNYRMTNVEATVGLEQLKRLPEFVETRRQNAHKLTEMLSEEQIITPTEPDNTLHAYNQYTVRCGNRSRVQEKLDENNIGHKVYYPTVIQELEAYHDLENLAPVGTPIAKQLASEVLSLPIHPKVSDADIERIADTLIDEGFSGPEQIKTQQETV